jgi:hypothetical protein
VATADGCKLALELAQLALELTQCLRYLGVHEPKRSGPGIRLSVRR